MKVKVIKVDNLDIEKGIKLNMIGEIVDMRGDFFHIIFKEIERPIALWKEQVVMIK